MKTTNYIQFEADALETAQGAGIISTIDRDIDITVVPFKSDNPKAPTHRVFAKSPRGYDIDSGAIWKRTSETTGRDYLALSIPRLGYNANLGKFAGQDDESLQAVIEWEARK